MQVLVCLAPVRGLWFDANFYEYKLEPRNAHVQLRTFHLFKLEN